MSNLTRFAEALELPYMGMTLGRYPYMYYVLQLCTVSRSGVVVHVPHAADEADAKTRFNSLCQGVANVASKQKIYNYYIHNFQVGHYGITACQPSFWSPASADHFVRWSWVSDEVPSRL